MISVASVLTKVADIFNPLEKLVDNVHTSGEEKLELRNKLAAIQSEITKGQLELMGKVIDLESESIKAQQAVLVAEAGSESWLASNWRPMTMITFVAMTSLHALGFIDMDAQMSERYFNLVEIGLGGYVVGRSLEKIAPSLAQIGKK